MHQSHWKFSIQIILVRTNLFLAEFIFVIFQATAIFLRFLRQAVVLNVMSATLLLALIYLNKNIYKKGGVGGGRGELEFLFFGILTFTSFYFKKSAEWCRKEKKIGGQCLISYTFPRLTYITQIYLSFLKLIFEERMYR